jgi:hypothetical protein
VPSFQTSSMDDPEAIRRIEADEHEVRGDPDPDTTEHVFQGENTLEYMPPITPDTASLENLHQVVSRYRLYLQERQQTSVTPETQARAQKVEKSIIYCEQVIVYWLSFLLADPDPELGDILSLCNMIQEENVGHYPVPNFWPQAKKLATDARRAPRNARPPTNATRGPKATTINPTPTPAPLSAYDRLAQLALAPDFAPDDLDDDLD